jgi:peptidyl-prolyl cis-trans isomerase A (cyclophilin A)
MAPFPLFLLLMGSQAGLLGYGSDAPVTEDDDGARSAGSDGAAARSGAAATDDDDDADAKPHKRRSFTDPVVHGSAIDGAPAIADSASQNRARLQLFDALFHTASAKAQAAKAAKLHPVTNSPAATFHTAVTWSTPKAFCTTFSLAVPPGSNGSNGAGDSSSPVGSSFTAKFRRSWAPQGVTHVLRLLRTRFFDGNRIFRYVPGFVAQWGINGAPALEKRWSHWFLADDPAHLHRNEEGTIAFASATKNGRSTQLFVNLGDNAATLDAQGFAPVGSIVRGLPALREALARPQAVAEVDSGGGGAVAAAPSKMPDQARMMREGDAYLDKYFPGLPTISTARMVPCPEE